MNIVLKKRLGIAVKYMMENFYEDLSLEDVAREARVDRWYLCRTFQKRFGMTPMRWLWLFRIYVAKEYMAMMPKASMTHVAFSCGFQSVAHFSRSFKSNLGCSPSEFKRSLNSDISQPTYNLYTDLYNKEDNFVLKKAFDKIISQHASSSLNNTQVS
jgi:transcriptional regulator GlxA family with amidase domain